MSKVKALIYNEQFCIEGFEFLRDSIIRKPLFRHTGICKIVLSLKITLNIHHVLIPCLVSMTRPYRLYHCVNRIRKCIVLIVDDFNCASHYQKNLQTWTFFCGNPLSLFVARNFLLIIEAVMLYFISFLSHQIFDSKTETKNEICILQKAVLQS